MRRRKGAIVRVVCHTGRNSERIQENQSIGRMRGHRSRDYSLLTLFVKWQAVVWDGRKRVRIVSRQGLRTSDGAESEGRSLVDSLVYHVNSMERGECTRQKTKSERLKVQTEALLFSSS